METQEQTLLRYRTILLSIKDKNNPMYIHVLKKDIALKKELEKNAALVKKFGGNLRTKKSS